MSRKVQILVSFLVLVSHGVFGQTHGTSPNWTYPTVLPKANAQGFATKGGVGQNIIRLSNGNIIQCFLEQYPYPSGQMKISFVKSTDDGATWSVLNINSPFDKTQAVTGPTFAKDNNDNIHVVWKSNASQYIYYAKFDKDFNLLIDTTRISQTIYHTLKGFYITVDRSDRVHIMWHDGDEGNTSSSSYFAKVMYRQSPNGGTTWNNQMILSDTTIYKHAAYPRANFRGCSGDTLAIPWRQEVTTSNWDVWMAYSTDGGVSWARMNVANSDSAEWDPGIVVDKNNRIHLHYHEYKKNNPLMSSIEYKYTDNLGTTWSPVQTLSLPNIRSQLTVFAYDASKNIQCICWKDERDFINPTQTRADVMCSFSTDSGQTWQGQEFVNDLDTLETIFKSVEVGSNGVLYVTFEYTDPSTGLRNIWFSKRDTVTTTKVHAIPSRNFWNLYPNPTTHMIFIDTKLPSFSLNIFNMMGVMVRSFQNNKSIDLSDLQPGAYLISFTSGDFYDSKTLIISR